MGKKASRHMLTIGAVALVAAGVAYAYWPRPMLVDMGSVNIGAMSVEIVEEGRTEVRDPYVLATPVAGRLMRVELHPGDVVIKGETVVAEMRPIAVSALDARTKEQAQASVTAANAALRVAQADLHAALADRDLAQTDLERTQALFDRGTVSKAALDRAQSAMRAAEARVDTARAAISMRVAELENAQAHLISFDDRGLAQALSGSEDRIPLYAPIDGRVLQVMQQSETTMAAGAPIMEIGDIDSGLEVVVELLSSDAVQVSVGDAVAIRDWGGIGDLPGVVRRVDPYGVTKYSALGVEEQRVDAVVDFTGPSEDRAGLGHGYRVEVAITVWSVEDAVLLPASALFRSGPDWAVFVVEEGVAYLRTVNVGRNNGVTAQVLDGLEAGDKIVLYPSSALSDGRKVAQRVIE